MWQRHLGLGLACAVGVTGCGRPARESSFARDSLITGRVLENRTACTVDAQCSLRLAFADTTIVVLYGSGEGPAPPCEIPREVADGATRLRPGDVVRVEIGTCGAEGDYLRRLRPWR